MVGKERFSALLGTPQRDFLVDNKGNQVPIKSLQGKIVGLYFSAKVGLTATKRLHQHFFISFGFESLLRP